MPHPMGMVGMNREVSTQQVIMPVADQIKDGEAIEAMGRQTEDFGTALEVRPEAEDGAVAADTGIGHSTTLSRGTPRAGTGSKLIMTTRTHLPSPVISRLLKLFNLLHRFSLNTHNTVHRNTEHLNMAYLSMAHRNSLSIKPHTAFGRGRKQGRVRHKKDQWETATAQDRICRTITSSTVDR